MTRIGGVLSRERRTRRSRGDWRRGRKQWDAGGARSRAPHARTMTLVKRKDQRGLVERALSSSSAHFRARGA
eukprot:4641008-Pleurochrysis_carterae.AAC.1